MGFSNFCLSLYNEESSEGGHKYIIVTQQEGKGKGLFIFVGFHFPPLQINIWSIVYVYAFRAKSTVFWWNYFVECERYDSTRISVIQ